jgi:hypothetical protein
MSRFVTPAEIRLPITDGDYLIVKAQLNTGETLDVFARMRAKDADGLDPLQVGIAVVVGYLLDWSLTDDAGQIVPVRQQPPIVVEAALRALDYADFQEIAGAVQAHDDKVKAAHQEKKRMPGSPAAVVSWPSPVAATGATNG